MIKIYKELYPEFTDKFEYSPNVYDDDVINFYSKIIDAETKCKIIVSSEEVIKIGNDKYLTYEFLKKNNVEHFLVSKY